MSFRFTAAAAVLVAAAATGLSAGGPALAATHSGPAGVRPSVVLPLQSRAMPGVDITNTHWSGYDAMKGDFTSVSASWTEPAVNCSQGGDVVFWVGLGGGNDSSDSLQQNGTFVQCEGTTPVYSAWWETYPCNGITNYGGTVKAGDKITASTVNEGDNKYKLTVTDSTEGWSVDPEETGCDGGSTATAEVITETPEIGGGLADLPDFKKVTYTDATINGDPLPDASVTKVVIARSGVTMDATSAITDGGETFSNTWKANS
jgi:hypothetical protein